MSEPTCFVVIQEGGSSGELYLNTYNTVQDATDFRRSCATAAYRTSEPIEVPVSLADHPAFAEVAEAIVRAGVCGLESF